MMLTQEEIERRFVYHAPNDQTRAFHDDVRKMMLCFAESSSARFSGASSRELALFYTALEEASFWLHAHIARNE